MPLSVEQFTQQLAMSGMMSADELRELLAALPPDQAPVDGDQLARELVTRKRLTNYQAEQICLGKGNSLVLGNYLILEKLGQGGMGMVLKAQHRRMKRLVALKVMSPAAVQTPDSVKRFHREVEAAAKLNHPNIVMAFDADEANETHFLVMEYVEGTDLSALVKRQGRLPVVTAVDCIRQVAQGLAFAHQHGVIHRDIKPANLLMDANGVVKILDMGLARIEGGAGAQSELTGSGAVMGTVDYMSPEQALNTKLADARSDIYSLGITLWYLLTGKCAYDGDSMMAKLLAHRDAPIPSLCTVRADVPESVDLVFRSMVAKQATDRFQSMADVLAALDTCQTLDSANFRVVLSSERSRTTETIQQRDSSSSSTLATESRISSEVTSQIAANEATVLTGDISRATDPDAPTRPATQSAMKVKSGRFTGLGQRRMGLGIAGGVVLAATVLYFTQFDGFQSWRSVDADPLKNAKTQNDVEGDAPLEIHRAPTKSLPSNASVTSPLLAVSPFDAVQAKAHQDAWAKHLGNRVHTTNSVGARMVLIPPGEFLMGSDASEIAALLKECDQANLPAEAFERFRIAEEAPQHVVTISRPFCMSATEVTVGQFREFVNATGYWTQGEQFGAGNSITWTPNPNVKPEDVAITWKKPGYQAPDNHPVTQVTWADAVEFCNWLSDHELLERCYERSGKLDWKFNPKANGYRLPTEAEWEFACRAGTQTRYWFGDDSGKIREYEWTAASNPGGPSAVATKPPNPFGLYDMLGNVREWCYDWYSSDTYAEPSQVDPIGPDVGSDRVMRGGRWIKSFPEGHSAFRYDIAPFLRNSIGGFRIVRGVLPSSTATDILMSHDYEWSAAQNLGPAINSRNPETAPSLSADRLSLFFSSVRAIGQGSLDLWEAHRPSPGDPFSTATNMHRVLNSFAADDSPSLSSDGLQLLFASNRPSSEGDYDLYLSRRSDPSAKWGPPVNLKPPINTPGREDCPVFSQDMLTLYFVSTRPDGLGQSDVWSCRRSSKDAAFGNPELIGAPVNSTDDETAFVPVADGRSAIVSRRVADHSALWLAIRKSADEPFTKLHSLSLEKYEIAPGPLHLTPDGQSLYFHSKRQGGEGDFDLWMTRRVEKDSLGPPSSPSGRP